MLKSELTTLIAKQQPHLQSRDVELAVNGIIEILTATLSKGERIEIRSFGSFATISRKSRMGRNPKTGEQVSIQNKYVPHFKPALELRSRVNDSKHEYPVVRDL